jgi:aminomethyltransferase
VSDIAVGQARYTLVTSDQGPDGLTILDDALVTREADAADGTPRFAMVVNASNRERVVAWLRSRLPATGVSFADRTADTAMIAVQGPLAVATVCVLCGDDDAGRISGLGNYRATRAFVAGQPAAVSRTGYTGEDGVEVVVAAAVAEDVWQAIHDAGRPRGLAACGLGARDTLRLEAGMPLYGHELVAGSDPFAIGLGLAVNLDDPTGGPRRFPGRDALAHLRAAQPARVRVGLAFDSKRAAREGSPVVAGGRVVGTVTSGSVAPSLGHAVAMALVDRDVATAATPLEVLIRDVPQAARMVPLPFYRRPGPPRLTASAILLEIPAIGTTRGVLPMAELKFAKSHEWVRPEAGGLATVGISKYAVEALTDLVFMQLPPVGKKVKAGESLGEIESVKAVSDIYAPVSGEIVEVNAALPNQLDTLGADPYGAGWIVRIKPDDPTELAGLLDQAAYDALVKS